MEEKKLDLNSIIGFVLIFGILIFMFYQNQPTPEELEAQKAEQENIEASVDEVNQRIPVRVSIRKMKDMRRMAVDVKGH